MSELGGPLVDEPAVQHGQVIVVLARPHRGGNQEGDDLPDAPDPPAGGLDRIGVSHRFRVIARVGAPGIGQVESVPGDRVLLPGPAVQGGPFGVGSAGLGDGSVAPPGYVDVPRTDPGDQVGQGDAVFRLGHVVEPGVVHDRGSVAHPGHPAPVPERIDRIGGAALLVVLVAQGVAHLVSHHELDQPAHQRIGERPHPGPGIEVPHLGEVPGPLEVHDVVVHVDVGLQDLARARVVHVRPGGVLDRGREPADDGVARVLRGPIRVLLRRRRVGGDDSAPEAGGLERRLPILDPLLHVRDEPGRCRRVNVVRDRFHRLGDRRRGVLLLQPPANDVLACLRPLLGARVVKLLQREVAGPLVEEPGHHLSIGELDHAPVHHHALARCRRWSSGDAGAASAARDRYREDRLDVHVLRKRHHALDEGSCRVRITRERAAGSDFAGRRREQARHLYDRC